MLNKYLKNVGLKRRQIISLPGAPTCLGPALFIQMPPHVAAGIWFTYSVSQGLISRLALHALAWGLEIGIWEVNINEIGYQGVDWILVAGLCGNRTFLFNNFGPVNRQSGHQDGFLSVDSLISVLGCRLQEGRSFRWRLPNIWQVFDK
jgi:hypothetical protein